MVQSKQTGVSLAPVETVRMKSEPEWRADLSSLLQFIAKLNHADNLDQVLNKMLRRAVRQIGIRRAAALVIDRNDRFVVRVTTGRGLRRLLGKRVDLTEVDVLSPYYRSGQTAEPLVKSLRTLLSDFPASVIVPVSRGERLLGILLFDAKATEEPFKPHELDFLTLFAAVTAAAIDTSLAQSEMRRANQRLSVRTQQLYTLFDVVREINLAQHSTEINRLLTSTLLSQVAISGCAVFTLVNGRFRLGMAHGIEVSGGELEHLLNTSLLGAILAQETAFRPAALHNRASADALLRWGIDYLAPMKSKEQIRGLLTISLTPSRAELNEEELEFIATLGNQAIIALENLRLREEMLTKERLEKEIAIARRIQQTLLPDGVPQMPGYEFAARGESYSEVGGDYHDFIRIDEHRLAIAIGDVTGKGVPAALLMASIHATVRALATSNELSCAEIVSHINRLLYQNVRGDSFITFFFGILDTNTNIFTSVNAGHCYPLLVKKTGKNTPLKTGGLVLGLLEDATYESEEHKIQRGDSIVMYTDGLSESVCPVDEEQFGDNEMLEVIQTPGQTAAEIVDALFTSCNFFTHGSPLHDDTTVLALSRIK